MFCRQILAWTIQSIFFWLFFFLFQFFFLFVTLFCSSLFFSFLSPYFFPLSFSFSLLIFSSLLLPIFSFLCCLQDCSLPWSIAPVLPHFVVPWLQYWHPGLYPNPLSVYPFHLSQSISGLELSFSSLLFPCLVWFFFTANRFCQQLVELSVWLCSENLICSSILSAILGIQIVQSNPSKTDVRERGNCIFLTVIGGFFLLLGL